jgi:ABC-type amino acid transport system permease subunit
MQLANQGSAHLSALGSQVHWQFRTLPNDVQRVTIRRLALSGLRDQEIAARTGLPEEAVRRVVAEDECLRMLLSPTPLTSGWLQTARNASLAN